MLNAWKFTFSTIPLKSILHADTYKLKRFLKNLTRDTLLKNFASDNYQQSVSIIDKIIPQILKDLESYQEQQLLGKFLFLLNVTKIDRKEVYDKIESFCTEEEVLKIGLNDLMIIFTNIINLKHKGHPKLKKVIKEEIFNRILRIKPNFISNESYRTILFFIRNLLLDVDKEELDSYLGILIKNILLKVPSHIHAKDSFYFLHSFLYEAIRVNQVQIADQYFQILKKSHQQFNHTGRDDILTLAAKQQILQSKKNSQFYGSTFERIFRNSLKALGYDFDSNVYIKGNQYDLIIKGKVKEKNYPFANIDIYRDEMSDLPRVSDDQLQLLSLSKDCSWIYKTTSLPEKVALDLNGPIHYINSDNGQNHKQISCLEELKYKKLKLHGVSRYNLINYDEWEKISSKTKKLQGFIEQKISQSIVL